MPPQLVNEREFEAVKRERGNDQDFMKIWQLYQSYCKCKGGDDLRTVQRQAGYLCMMLDACMDWLSRYTGTDHSTKKAREVVKKLHKKIIALAIESNPESYLKRLETTIAVGPKALDASYQGEMFSFLNYYKGEAHNEHKAYHILAAYRDVSDVPELKGMLLKEKKDKLEDKDVQRLRINPNETIGRMREFGPKKIQKSLEPFANPILLGRLVDRTDNVCMVLYMRKFKRLQHKLEPHGDILRMKVPPDFNLVPFDTGTDTWLYAASYGNPPESGTDPLEFIAVDVKNEPRLNHSSVFKGRPVLCAGMVAGSKGKITFISNNSGHYKPSWRNLRTLLKRMYTYLAHDATVSCVGFGSTFEQIEFPAKGFADYGFGVLPVKWFDQPFALNKYVNIPPDKYRGDRFDYLKLLKKYDLIGKLGLGESEIGKYNSYQLYSSPVQMPRVGY
jgi:hypothetical protein